MHQQLNESKQKIESRLNEIINNEIEIYKDNIFINDYLLELKRLSDGGKRIRGFLTKVGQLIASVDDDSYLDIAVAMEIFQTGILIHDDIIDKADTRRGKETINGKYKGHTGTAKGICAGDLGFFLAFKVLSGANIDPTRKEKLLKIFSETIYKTILGEIVDVELPLLKFSDCQNIDNDIVESVYLNKTAWYTIIGPLLLGFCSIKDDPELEKTILDFGKYIGFSFQIRDDLLDLYAEEKILGKPKLGDIREGKQTIIHRHALENADKEDLYVLEKYFGQENITREQAEEIFKIYIKLESDKYAEKEIEKYTNKAIEIINNINDIDVKVKNLLLEFCLYLSKRTY